ncbi:hypothetical protein F3Y22_tig00110114pilonHSYRG00382 [Hibiscus syriacus]|uniref:Amino acid transporter transmembrane domain-containing protein n=1 Tax=Hibiscus syriacus TaxID=106335 RepID=A0A6A3BHV2_HIBSY|nr:hypothetical protein F3Y22_tig00110114pilonHSYRG00382 [Hibiscus syriacus]
MVYETPESDRDKAINEWLPVTSNRDAKWWYSTFHNVAGVLSLPYAMAQLGWYGVSFYVKWGTRGYYTDFVMGCDIVTLYTLRQMVQMHEMIPSRLFDRYHELGQYAFGENLVLWFIIRQQLTVDVSSDIIYMVMGGQSLKKFHDLVCPNCPKIRHIFHHDFRFGPLYSFPSPKLELHIRYSTIAWIASAAKGAQPDVDYSYKDPSTSRRVFNFLAGLGEIGFAYAGHNVVLEIQATMPSTPEKPSKGPIVRKLDDNILVTLEKPLWLIATANMFVVIHFIGSYQVFAMPVFDMIESFLLPCIIWLIICKPKRFSLIWYMNWICIVFGVLLMVLSPIGGLRSIIVSAKDYKFFS